MQTNDAMKIIDKTTRTEPELETIRAKAYINAEQVFRGFRSSTNDLNKGLLKLY